MSKLTLNIVEPASPTPTPVDPGIDPSVPSTGLFTHGIGGTEATIITVVSAVLLLTIVAIVLAVLYKKHKKQGKTTKLVHIVDSTKAIITNKKRITASLTAIALLVSAGTFIALAKNAVNATDTDEQAEGEDDSSLTVNVSEEELTIELGDEPVFAILPVELTVEEATQAGYTLTAYTDNTDLVSTTNPDNIIPMVTLPESSAETLESSETAGELVALANNTYGLALEEKPTTKDEAVYTALSIDSEEPTVLKSMPEYTPTAENDTTTIYYGFYITPDIPYGTYTGSDINYNAISNSSTVVFNGNGLYFNDDEKQTTNIMEYAVTPADDIVIHSSNVDNNGDQTGKYGEEDYLENITIPGANTIKVNIKYGITAGTGWVTIAEGNWDGNYGSIPENSRDIYSTNDNLSGIEELTFNGDTVTIYSKSYGIPEDGYDYGYYITVTGYDAEGNIVHFTTIKNLISGTYSTPISNMPYKFLGWSEDKDATKPIYTTEEEIERKMHLVPGKTTTLYAIWQHATRIHLDGNGSTSGTMSDQVIVAGTPQSLTPNAYAKDGYIFNGWNTAADGTGESYPDQGTYIAPASKSQDITLYAQWAATTITFSGNGATSGSMDQFNVPAGTTANLPQNTFTRTGYVFNGWNTSPDGTGTSYSDQSSYYATAGVNTSVILHAQWLPTTTITFNGNDATSGTMSDQVIVASTPQNLTPNALAKEGYAFNGWNTSADGTGESYPDQGTYIAPVSESQNITLYAQWAYYTTITFNGNGADSGSMAPQTVVAGTPQNLTPNAFAKEGYEFNGWNTNAEGTGTSYADRASYSASTTKLDSFTLYAQWEKLPVIGDLTYMQDFATLSEKGKASVLNSMSQETSYTLKDKRDEQDYTVAKLKDNNIWMTKNLNLAGGTEITSELSNVPDGYTLPTANGFQEGNKLPASSTSGFNDDTKAFVYNSTKTSGTGCSSGCYSYYSWTAATAGSGLSITADNTDAPYSICPKGWKLPSTRTTSVADWKTESDFYKLAVAYGMNSSVIYESTANFYNQAGPDTTPNFLFSGRYNNVSFNFGGSEGYYWSSTSYNSTRARSLYFYWSYVASAYSYYRRDGYAMRCIAQ